MKKNFTKVLLAAAAMTTLGLSYATNSGLLAFAAEEEPAEEPAEMVITPAFVSGNEEYALNSHSAVVVPGATAIVANFENGPEVKHATYSVDMLTDEEGIFEYVTSGAFSINGFGYADLDEPVTFVTGKQYVLTVKAWNVPSDQLFDENWVMAQPIKVETFNFNGGTGMGVIGEPAWGLDRFVLPGDMVNLGVPVRFPEVALPFGIAAEDCEITVSATLVEIPSNYGQPADDDEVDPGFGVQPATVIKDGELHYAHVEGGVVTAFLFPEIMEEGKSYAIVLNAVTFINEGEIVAELPEDADYEVQFEVTPAAPQVTLGEPEWGIDGGVVTEDQINLGIQVRFPDAVLGEEVNPNDVILQVSAMLYGVLPQGAEGGIAPLSANDDDENIDPEFTNRLLPLLEEPAVFCGDALGGGVLSAFLFPGCEDLAVGNEYVIVLTDVKAMCGDQPVAWMSEDSEWLANFVVAELPEEAEMAPEFVCGEESIALSNHSAVSVETAEALAVKFVNAPGVRYATYAIDRVLDEEAVASVATGELSVSTVGYVAFEKPLVFVAGQQYKLTVKAWNTTEIVDAELNVVEPALCEVYTFNGAANQGLIGEPVFGVERGEFPEDMLMLGVPVRFPEMLLPFGVDAEDCEITVSASLYGVPEGNEPMPLSEDDDIDGGMGVDGPVALAVAQIHHANVVGGVVTAYLFAEQMEVGNHYAIVLNAVTVQDAEGNIVAELGEDEYFDTDFVVTPYVAPIEFGQLVWAGIDENNNLDVEEANINGVVATFPFANLGTEDAVISIFATLYDVTNMGAVVEDDVDNMGVQGPVAVDQKLFFGGFNVESGVYEVALFPEAFEPAHSYVISVETITAELDDEVLCQWDNVEEECTVAFDAVGELPAEIDAALAAGDEQIALSNHSAVSVETAESLVVRFVNAPAVKYATYSIDRVLDDEAVVSVATGELSLSTVGYASFEKPLVFVAGHQYKLTVKAWNTTEIVDAELNVADPDLCEVYTFNGASATGIIGEPEWGLELGEEFAEDMINIGLPVRFPELVLPFGVELEDSEICVSATLVGVPEGNEPMPLSEDDDIDGGMGVDGPVVLAEAVLFYANVEGGVATAYLFPEMMEAGNHYAVIINAVTVTDAEGNLVAELDEDAYFDIDFVVAEGTPTSINGINAEKNGKVMINLFGQKVSNAQGVVILNGQKMMVK